MLSTHDTLPVATRDCSGGYRGVARGHAPLEAHVPTLPLQKSVESKAGKRDFKNT